MRFDIGHLFRLHSGNRQRLTDDTDLTGKGRGLVTNSRAPALLMADPRMIARTRSPSRDGVLQALEHHDRRPRWP